MKTLEERLKSYEPFWGQWRLGNELYACAGTRAFEVSRTWDGETVTAMLRVAEIRGTDAAAETRMRNALDTYRKTEQLSDCPQVVTMKAEELYPVCDENGAAIGWDFLFLQERLVSLEEELQNGRAFTKEEARCFGIDICRALAYAHRRECFHGEITPGCLYRRPAGGFYMIADFGGFEQTGEERLKTECYAAPELLMGESPTKESDMYSLGLILYQLLNENRLPFEGSVMDVRERLLNGETWSLAENSTKTLNQVITMACNYEAEKRFYEASDFRLGLEHAKNGTAIKEPGKLTFLGRPMDHRMIAGFCLASFLAGMVFQHVVIG